MKKFTTISLISSLSIIIFIITAFLIEADNITSYQSRIEWSQLFLTLVIFIPLLLFEFSLLWKSFSSKTYIWQRIILTIIFAIIITISIIIFIKEHKTIDSIITSLLALGLLISIASINLMYIIKKKIWIKVYFNTLTIIFSAFSLIILFIIFSEIESKEVKADKYVAFINETNNKKIVVQSDNESEYLIYVKYD
ncbi:MAG: hypothetical protein IPO21_09810 [Bacteroidales bacterium]|nr:hypothetical protein [Bacteroidales bacterium]